MSWNEKNQSLDGMTEQGFQLEVNNQNVPGLYWKPENGDSKYLVLLGHGGSASKTADYIVNMARLLAGRGISSMAIDGPGHGERATQDFGTGPDAFSNIWEEGRHGTAKKWNTPRISNSDQMPQVQRIQGCQSLY